MHKWRRNYMWDSDSSDSESEEDYTNKGRDGLEDGDVKYASTKGLNKQSDEKNDCLDWDDDAFEVPDMTTEHEQTPPPPLHADTSMTTWTNPSTAEEEEEEAWLVRETVAAPPTICHDGLSSVQALTSLSTPASKKKPRCAECTMPLKEGSTGRLCARCAPA